MFYASLHWNSFENDFSFRPLTQNTLALTHTHTQTRRQWHNKQWSEVNLLDILYALNARRTSSSSAHPESIKCVFGPLSASSAARRRRRPPQVVAICLPDSDRIRSEDSPSIASRIYIFLVLRGLGTLVPCLLRLSFAFCRHASLSPLISR